MTHGNVGIIAADQDLSAVGLYPTVAVDAGVDDGLFAAGADGFDLGDRVRHLEQASTSGKQVCQKIGAQTEAQHGYVVFIDDTSELVDLFLGEKLTFVCNDRVNILFSGARGEEKRTDIR